MQEIQNFIEYNYSITGRLQKRRCETILKVKIFQLLYEILKYTQIYTKHCIVQNFPYENIDNIK